MFNQVKKKTYKALVCCFSTNPSGILYVFLYHDQETKFLSSIVRWLRGEAKKSMIEVTIYGRILNKKGICFHLALIAFYKVTKLSFV